MAMSSDWGACRMWLNGSALTRSINSGADEAGFSRRVKKRSLDLLAFFELRIQGPGIVVKLGTKRGALEDQPELPGGHLHHVNRALMEDSGLGMQQRQDAVADHPVRVQQKKAARLGLGQLGRKLDRLLQNGGQHVLFGRGLRERDEILYQSALGQQRRLFFCSRSILAFNSAVLSISEALNGF